MPRRLPLAALTAATLALPAVAPAGTAGAADLRNPIAPANAGAPPLSPGGRAVAGGRGDDRPRGGRGDDVIRARRGDDRARGGDGDDALFGGPGADRLAGGRGDDLIVDTEGRDRVAAGPGDDRVNVRDGRPGDRVACGPGRDTVVADRGDRVASDCEVVLDGRHPLVRRDATAMGARDRRDFVAALKLLKATPSPYDADLNWYDQFVAWHDEAFADAAHGSPAFLPWHREFLSLFEAALQTVSGKPIALPYWDWTDPRSTAAVFADDLLGPDGDRSQDGAVTRGPFRRGAWRVWVRDPASVQPLVPEAGEVGAEPSWIERNFGTFPGLRLPTTADVRALLGVAVFDSEEWDEDVLGSESFRNALEGWSVLAPGMGSHNSVHVWAGGEEGTMSKTTSPNDPAFWLHHNNVDRVWEQWSRRNGRVYRPESGAREGANLRDAMAPFRDVGIRAVPANLLATEPLGYVFDDLASGATARAGSAAPAARVAFAPSDAAAARAGLLCVLPN